MKTAIITYDESRKETDESIVFLTTKEIGIIVEALTAYRDNHRRSKLANALTREFEMLPCQQPRKLKLLGVTL